MRFEKSYNLLDQQFEKLHARANEAHDKAKELEEYLDGARAEVERLREDKDQLALRVMELEEEVARLGRENSSLKGDVSAAEDMIGMVDRQHEDRLEAYKKKVAHDLNADYLDFRTANDIEMDVEVGESMRLLIESVFETLEKNGIVP